MELFYSGCGQGDGSRCVYALLECAVSLMYGISLPEIRKTEMGKPFFPARPDIHFSISHTKTHVFAAVSDAPVGVDVELLRPVRPGVAARVCTVDELTQFDFFELWVLKESYIKLTGNTRAVLNRIAFGRAGGRIVTPDDAVAARLYDDIPGCRAAVCSAGAAVPGFIRRIDDLIF